LPLNSPAARDSLKVERNPEVPKGFCVMEYSKRIAILADVESDIQSLEAELSELRRLAAYLSREPHAASNHTASVAIESADSNRFAESPTLADAIQTILRDNGNRPMRAKEIGAFLTGGGYQRASSDERAFANTVFSSMSRRPDLFSKLGRGRWVLREEVS
jgi:hypothetical protein